MTATLCLEAFGQLPPDTAVIDAEAEDLHSVFRTRAELLGWASARRCGWDRPSA